ncbi:hypothetical protein [Christiangramia echinicola]|uniref:Bacteriorhodopsin n=1 Tax=Christiangramia echinicola TaxID=279359 RepID=A0A1H1QEQ6_9FLAO|nr:hypothetical protein [Christiangramia echinicola]SDS22041.1 hypothetical protein SAMN04488552_2489 [Christiangramia echinicola]
MKEYLIYIFETKIYITHLMELIAAVAGSIFLTKTNRENSDYKIFVRFLWSVLLIDILGGYAALAYFSNYELFGFIKGTPFVRNEWYFNIVEVYFILIYTYLFRSQLSGRRMKNLLKWSIVGYLIIAVLNMYLSDDFFTGDLMLNDMLGAFLIVLSVFFYFFDMMISDKVLTFYKNLFFYVAIGVTISYLVRVPISIYGAYFNERNDAFLELFYDLVRYTNIFMYSMFAMGFYMDYRYRKKWLLQNT